MSVQCAARFTPPPPVDPAVDRDMLGRSPGSAAQRGLGAGVFLLLSGGAAASAWALPAGAHAHSEQTAPAEEQAVGSDLQAENPEIAVVMPVSPLWSPPAEDGTAEYAPAGAVTGPQPSAPVERIQDRLAQGTLSLRSGETLWSLTGELLGPDASPAEIARGWPLLWEANADQIRDPDRVAAGTVLQIPPTLLPEQ